MKKRDEAYADRLFGYVLWNEYLTGQSRQSIETLSDYMGIRFPFEITQDCALVISGMERIAYREYGVTAIDYDGAADRLWREQIRPGLAALGCAAVYTMEIYNEFKHLVYILAPHPDGGAHPVSEAVRIIHDTLQRHFAASFLPPDSPHGNFTVYAEGLQGQSAIIEAFNRLRHMHGYTFFSPRMRIHEAGALERLRVPEDGNRLIQAQRDYSVAVYNQNEARAMQILCEEIGVPLRRSLNRALCLTTMNALRLSLLEIHTLHELPTHELEAAAERRHNTFDGMLDEMIGLTRLTLGLLSERHLRYSPVVRQALLYLRAHYADSIQLADVAEYAGVSTSYLSRMFNGEVGASLPSYLLRLRLEAACHALKTGQETIAAISSRCGFASPGYFCRLFRRKMGMTPMEYRLDDAKGAKQ